MSASASLTVAIDSKLDRVERAIEAQKSFIHRVPDPDTRERADGHLIELVEMRDRMRRAKLETMVV